MPAQTRIDRIAQAFGEEGPAVPLAEGGRAWRAGEIVLKPAAPEADAVADIVSRLSPVPDVRWPRPVPALSGAWRIDGHVAWEYLEGALSPFPLAESLAASDAFHRALGAQACPAEILGRGDPWARADRVAWQEAPLDYAPDFAALMAPLLRELRPVKAPSQLIHADLTGNFVQAPGLPPGIIDITLYWRPVAFAKAVILADLAWFGRTIGDAEAFAEIPEIRQMFLRAELRRIAEQPEQVRAHGKDWGCALRTARTCAAWAARVLPRLPDA